MRFGTTSGASTAATSPSPGPTRVQRCTKAAISSSVTTEVDATSTPPGSSAARPVRARSPQARSIPRQRTPPLSGSGGRSPPAGPPAGPTRGFRCAAAGVGHSIGGRRGSPKDRGPPGVHASGDRREGRRHGLHRPAAPGPAPCGPVAAAPPRPPRPPRPRAGRSGRDRRRLAGCRARHHPRPRPGWSDPGVGGARRAGGGAVARCRAGHRHVPPGGRPGGAGRPARRRHDRLRPGRRRLRRSRPGRGRAPRAAGRVRALPRHPLAGPRRLPPGGRLAAGQRPRVRPAVVAPGRYRPDRVGAGLRWPGRRSRHDPGDDPRPPAGRVGGRDGGHPRHRRRGAGPRPDLRPGRRADAVPPGHLAPVRRRRQRRRALRPAQRV